MQTKRDQLSVKVTRFYRPEDVPEDSYSLLLQDRQDDTSLNHTVMAAMQTRELFSSEISSVHPICHLRFVSVFNNVRLFIHLHKSPPTLSSPSFPLPLLFLLIYFNLICIFNFKNPTLSIESI